ncbi:MAG: hypothetical protein IAF38_06945 [Bacteroidia bacterium]|nr:hypothetical protein [Bacteroidia bacterium]
MQKRLYRQGFYTESKSRTKREKSLASEKKPAGNNSLTNCPNEIFVANKSNELHYDGPVSRTSNRSPATQINCNKQIFFNNKNQNTNGAATSYSSHKKSFIIPRIPEEIDFEKERRIRSDARVGLFFSLLAWACGLLGALIIMFIGGRGLVILVLGILFALLGIIFSASSIKLNNNFPFKVIGSWLAELGLVMGIMFFVLFIGITYLSLSGFLF